MADKEEPADDAGKEEPKEEAPAEPEEKKDEEEDSSSSDLVDKANEAADRLEKENERMEANVKIQEQMKVEKTLSGKAAAGTPQKKETDEEYADKVAKGEANPLEDDGFKT